ncbi:MAG: DUF4340 domain-containing protein [Gammaproteobacteria bacterium]|nr:DUF4340 domain-containing protein [Gammaproteobacteria bacterium]
MKTSTLTIVLGAQLLLVALVWGLQTGGGEEPDPFLSFDAAAVDSLSVADDEQSVTVTRADGAWTVAGGLPADANKVDRVLDKLADAEGGWPVATSDSAMTRFEVTEDEYQRHIVVGAGDDTLADVYLGTSPSYQRVHARHASGGPVYAIDFSNYEAGAKVSDWLKKSLLQPDGTLQSIARAGEQGWTLTSADDGWTAEGATLDPEETAEYTARFTGLNVLGIVDVDLPEEPVARFVLTDDAGAHELALFHLEEEDDYVATSDRYDGQFEIAKYVAERLDASLDDLVADADEAAAEGEGEDDGAA